MEKWKGGMGGGVCCNGGDGSDGLMGKGAFEGNN